MKKLLFGAAALMLIASCSNKENNGQNAEVTPATATQENVQPQDAPAAAEVAPEAAQTEAPAAEAEEATQKIDKAELEASARKFVDDMYAVVFKKNGDYVNNTYFTPEFVKLYKQTVKTESKKMSESDSDGGMDEQFFDDEFWSSYNDSPIGSKAKIVKITVDENGKGQATANVSVRISPEYGNENPIKLNLVKTDAGWKVDDYRGFKKYMRKYVK